MPSESQARGIKRGTWGGGRAYLPTCKRRARGMLVGFTPLRGLRRVTSRDVSVAHVRFRGAVRGRLFVFEGGARVRGDAEPGWFAGRHSEVA